jgi:hypothetical protein
MLMDGTKMMVPSLYFSQSTAYYLNLRHPMNTTQQNEVVND